MICKFVTTAPKEFKVGTVTTILHPGNKGDGFISETKQLGYYFRMQELNVNKELALNDNVCFKLKSTTHRGKTKEQAYDIYTLTLE